jgi:hypothetical protein
MVDTVAIGRWETIVAADLQRRPSAPTEGSFGRKLDLRSGGVSFRRSQARNCLIEGCDGFELLIRLRIAPERIRTEPAADDLAFSRDEAARRPPAVG